MQPLPLPKIRLLQSALRWRPGAPACRSRRVPQAGVADNRGGSVCLNSFAGFLSGASAGVRPPRVAAAG